MNQRENGVEIWGLSWSSSRVKLNTMESFMPIRGVIRKISQIKRLKPKYPKRRHFEDDYSSSSAVRLPEAPPSQGVWHLVASPN
jgi:hypothetical protein